MVVGEGYLMMGFNEIESRVSFASTEGYNPLHSLTRILQSNG
jgi:hypothetical protein